MGPPRSGRRWGHIKVSAPEELGTGSLTFVKDTRSLTFVKDADTGRLTFVKDTAVVRQVASPASCCKTLAHILLKWSAYNSLSGGKPEI